MANDTIGYTFDPTNNQRRLLQGVNRGGQLGPMANEALRVLSLRLPNVLGGRPLSPDELLRAKLGTTPAPAPVPAPLPTAGTASGSLNVGSFERTPYASMPFNPPSDSTVSGGSYSGEIGTSFKAPTITPGDDQQQQFKVPTGDQFRRILDTLLGGAGGTGGGSFDRL